MSVTSANLGSTPGTDNKPIKWAKIAEYYEREEDYFTPMESTSGETPVEVSSELANGETMTCKFNSIAGLYGDGKMQDASFDAAADFEEIVMGSDELKVDFLRHAVSWNERFRFILGDLGREITAGLPKELGKWMGRKKSNLALQTLKYRAGTENNIIAGDKTTIDLLTPADTFDYNALVDAGTILERNGGFPAFIGMDADKNKLHKCIVAMNAESLGTMQKDPDWISAMKACDVRGMSNAYFRGTYAQVSGHILRKYTAIDHDGHGPVGSPLSPKAKLGTAIATGTAAVAIKGGGSAAAAAKTGISFLRDFPLNSGFTFVNGDTIDWNTTYWSDGQFYVAIVNPKDPALGANSGKWGFYRCTANTGKSITMDLRLGAAISGIAHTTVGDLLYDPNVNTDVHPIGADVILTNSAGVPLFNSVVMGRGALRRGYGVYRNHRGYDRYEDEFKNELYIKTIFGQECRKDASGRYPGHLSVVHAGRYAGMSHYGPQEPA